jgi:hypothetical protein
MHIKKSESMGLEDIAKEVGKATWAMLSSDVGRGMLLQAARDIFIVRTDRDKGHVEVKYANAGDDLEVLGPDADNPNGGFRVMNKDNYDEVETVQAVDLDDTFHDYN